MLPPLSLGDLMRATYRTIAILAVAMLSGAASSALAATAADDLFKLTWRDYEAIWVQDSRPVSDSPDFIHTAKAKKLVELDKQCKATVKAALDKEAPAQVGDDKTANDRKIRIARGYLTCMMTESKQYPTLAHVSVVVSHRRTKDEVQPFQPGDKTSYTD